MDPEPSKDYFNRLDTLRFLAFFMVFANHLASFLHYPKSVGIPGSFFFTYLQIGDLGVGFFFVLSGFLITYLLEKERIKNGRISIKNFYIRRVLRIWPLYFLAIAIIILFSFIFRGFDLYKISLDWPEIWRNLIFIGNFFKAFHYTSNEMIAILWSIAVEEQFYLVWPVLFVLFRKYITYLLIIGIAISMYFRYQYANNFPVREFFTLCVMVYLMVGALAGIHGTKIRSWIEKQWKSIITLGFLGFFILLSVRGLAFGNSYPNWFIAFDGLAFAIIFASIILASAFGGLNKKKSRLERKTEYLGTVSYGLYIYHLIALTIVLNVLEYFGLNYNQMNFSKWILVVISTLLLVVLLASNSYKYFERPFLKLKEKFIPRS